MGERGANLEPPTEHDLSEMRRLTKEAIDAGALGVSSSRSLTHRFRDGRPAPSTKTEVDELLALAGGLKDAGTGVFQLIPNFDNHSREEFAVIRKLAEASGRPVSFTLFTGEKVVGGWREFTSGIEKALADNLTMGSDLPSPHRRSVWARPEQPSLFAEPKLPRNCEIAVGPESRCITWP